jgi:transcriptional regulator with XRE-family HTH domain
MLNYNKIHSAINFDRTSKRSLAKYLGVGESTLRSRLGKENLTPDDVEKIAEFFSKPIAYFFDKEEKEAIKDKGEVAIKCKECEKKDKEIEQLRKELIEIQRRYIHAIEMHNRGKLGQDFQKKDCE